MKKERRRKKRDPPHPPLSTRKRANKTKWDPPLDADATERRQSFVIKRYSSRRRFTTACFVAVFVMWFLVCWVFFFFFFLLGRDLLTGQIFRSAAYMTDDVCPHPLSALNHPKVEWGGEERQNERKEMGRNSRLVGQSTKNLRKTCQSVYGAAGFLNC